MTTFPTGLYESLVTEALAVRLAGLPDDRRTRTDALRTAEAPDRIAWHIAAVVERAIEMLPESQRTTAGLALARALVDRVVEATDVAELTDHRPRDPAELLRAVHRLRPDGRPAEMDAPLIPLLDSALLTNSPGEPAVGHQVATEMASADRIDLIMAFIRRSGIRPLIEGLRKHVEAGGRLRVLTTTYTGSTEAAALDWLAALVDRLRDVDGIRARLRAPCCVAPPRNSAAMPASARLAGGAHPRSRCSPNLGRGPLGADVRVSYDTTSTRLHAKAWLFHRDSGFSTAYVGSSNLTYSAQTPGLEWNVRISGARNRSIVDKVAAVFESYWEEADFEPYDRARFDAAVGESGWERLPVRRSARRDAVQHAPHADVFVQVGPPRAFARAYEMDVRALLRCCLGQAPRPRQRDADGPAVREDRRDLVVRNGHGLHERLRSRRSARPMHSVSPHGARIPASPVSTALLERWRRAPGASMLRGHWLPRIRIHTGAYYRTYRGRPMADSAKPGHDSANPYSGCRR